MQIAKKEIGGSNVEYIKYGTTIKNAIIHHITSIYNIHSNYGKLLFDKKNKDVLGYNIYIYECGNIRERYNNYDGSIRKEVFSGTIKESLSKYDVEYEIKDTSGNESQRKSIFSKASKIAKSVLDDAAKLDYWDNCYHLFKPSMNKDFYEDFIEGLENSVPLIEYEIKDRDYFRTEECAKVANFVLNNLKERIKDQIKDATVESDGDWDGGSFDLVLK